MKPTSDQNTGAADGASFEILSQEHLNINTEDDIVVVRQKVRSLAQEETNFDSFAVAALTTASSELARNIWTHAGAGEVQIERIRDSDRVGIRMIFSDQGPGIADIDRVMKGGYSTARSLGLGLSGTRRLVDEFEIQSEPGRGTRVGVVKWAQNY